MKADIILLQRQTHSRGFILDEETNRASRLAFDFESEEGEETSFMLSCLDSINKCMEHIDVNKFTDVAQVYIPSNVLRFINQGIWKYWLFNKTMADGTELSSKAIDIVKEFADNLRNGMCYYVLRDIRDCYISEETQKSPYKMRKVSNKRKSLFYLVQQATATMDVVCPKEKKVSPTINIVD